MNFQELVKIAYFSNDNTLRTQAESQLHEFVATTPENFFREAADNFSQQQDPSLIQAYATLLKNAVNQKDIQNNSRWLTLQPPTKLHVKDQLLGQLINPNLLVKKAAAHVISAICSYELPLKQWNEIIPILVQNTGHSDLNIRQSSIITLGFICEGIKNLSTSCLESEEMEKILYGICMGLKKEEQNDDIKKISTKALQDSVGMIENFLKQQQIREYVLTMVLENLGHQNEDIVLASLQCLIDMNKIIFLTIDQYLGIYWQFTALLIKSNNQEIGIAATEVWGSLASEIKERRDTLNPSQYQQFIQAFKQFETQIVPTLLENLLKQQNSTEDEESLSIVEASYRALSNINEILDASVISIITNYISVTIANQSDKYKLAAILAFGSMVECPNLTNLEQIIIGSLSEFVKFLQYPNPKIQIAASKVLQKIADNYHSIFLQHENFKMDFPQILSINCSLAVASNLAWTLCFLTENMKNYPHSPIWGELSNILAVMEATYTRHDIIEKDVSLIDTCFMVILNVIYNINNKTECSIYLSKYLEIFKMTYAIPEANKRQHIQSGIMTTIHGCLLQLDQTQQLISDQMVNEVKDTIFTYFQYLNDVNSDGLYCLAGLANNIKGKFKEIMQQSKEFISFALKKTLDSDTFKGALFCIADIARAMDKEFAEYLPIVDFLLLQINDANFDRENKIFIFQTLADIFLSAREKCASYVDNIMNVMKAGFEAVVNLQKDPQTIEYAERLKDALIQLLTCILHANNDQNKSPFENLLPYFNYIVAFIDQTSIVNVNPTVEYIRCCLNLIVDMANFYRNYSQGVLSKNLMTSNTFLKLFNILKNYQDQQDNVEVFSYARNVAQKLSIVL